MSKYAANPNLRHVILDNGAGRIKYGPPTAPTSSSSAARANELNGSADDMQVESSASSSSSSSSSGNSRDRGAGEGRRHGNSIPNCVARMNKQMQVLVGEEVDSIANGSLLTYTRPFERGYMTNVHCQIEVWSRLFNKVLNVCTACACVYNCVYVCVGVRLCTVSQQQ